MERLSRIAETVLINNELSFAAKSISEALCDVVRDLCRAIDGSFSVSSEVEDIINFFAESNPEILNEIDESFFDYWKSIQPSAADHFITVRSCPDVIDNPNMKTAFISYQSDNLKKVNLPNVEVVTMPNVIAASRNIQEVNLPELKVCGDAFHVISAYKNMNDLVKITTSIRTGGQITRAMGTYMVKNYTHVNLHLV